MNINLNSIQIKWNKKLHVKKYYITYIYIYIVYLLNIIGN
jgi:hypothetical protein